MIPGYDLDGPLPSPEPHVPVYLYIYTNTHVTPFPWIYRFRVFEIYKTDFIREVGYSGCRCSLLILLNKLRIIKGVCSIKILHTNTLLNRLLIFR